MKERKSYSKDDFDKLFNMPFICPEAAAYQALIASLSEERLKALIARRTPPQLVEDEDA